MNVLLIDVYSSYLDFALRCKEAGHDVRWFQGKTREGLPSTVGRGMVQRVPHWEPHMNWADIILLADNVKYIHALEGWRKRGYPIWGPNLEVADWELNRQKGQEVLRRAGVKVMESTAFTSLKKAQEWLAANPGRYVSKPNAEDNKALSYVAKSARDLMFMLEYWQKNSKIKADFILQKFVPGVEAAVGGWFGREGFVGGWLENFEHKKLMNGDVGVNTGEMGTVMKYVRESALADALLKPLEGELYRQGFTGYLDVSVIVDRAGNPLPLEFTSRPGWPLNQILQSLHQGDPVQWMYDALQGEDTVKESDDVAAGVVMAIPDFPYSRLTKKEVSGYPVYGWEKVASRNWHPAEVMMGEVWQQDGDRLYEEEGLVTAGDYVCVVSGNGDRVSEACERAYTNLKKIELPNSPMYRTDIGERLKDDLTILKSHGFCKDWRY